MIATELSWDDGGNETNFTEFSSLLSDCNDNLTQGDLHAQYVNRIFGQCIYNLRQYFAFYIGLSSILCWLLAQAPQMVVNCRRGIADKALSVWFLIQWFLGDATNLAGAILTGQLATQTATAVYFVFIDTIMLTQFLFYVVRNQGWRGLIRIFQCPKEGAALIILPGLMLTVMWTAWNPLWGGNPYTNEHRVGRVLLMKHSGGKGDVVNMDDPNDVAGYILGCISAVFYLGSRMPQIYQNFARCSVDGLSFPMFLLAVMGNVTYGLGIFLYSVEPVFLLRKLPWLVGSVGTLCFDFTVLMQFVAFRCCCRQCGKEDDERRPLLNSASINGLPCVDKKGSIQTSTSTDSYSDKRQSASPHRTYETP